MIKRSDKTNNEEVFSASAPTEASKIWNDIKNKSIDMFALHLQKVSDHCTPVDVEPSKLYLVMRSSAVLPALETSCGANFVFDFAGKYITVARATSK